MKLEAALASGQDSLKSTSTPYSLIDSRMGRNHLVDGIRVYKNYVKAMHIEVRLNDISINCFTNGQYVTFTRVHRHPRQDTKCNCSNKVWVLILVK